MKKLAIAVMILASVAHASGVDQGVIVDRAGAGGGGFASPATASLDMDGQDIILDPTGNSRLELSADNILDIYFNSVLEWTFDGSLLNARGNRIGDSTDELNLGTAAEAGSATSVGDALVGGALEVNGALYADGGLTLPATGVLQWSGRGSFVSTSGSIVRCGDSSSIICGVQMRKPLLNQTAAAHTVASIESNSIYSNTGATVRIDSTLPSAVIGQCWHFAVNDTDGVKIIAPSSHVIYDGASASATAGYICSTTRGSTIEICAIENGATFMAMGAKSGTWNAVDTGCP